MFKKRWIVNVYDVQDNCVSDCGTTFTQWGARRQAKLYSPPSFGAYGPMYELRIERI